MSENQSMSAEEKESFNAAKLAISESFGNIDGGWKIHTRAAIAAFTLSNKYGNCTMVRQFYEGLLDRDCDSHAAILLEAALKCCAVVIEPKADGEGFKVSRAKDDWREIQGEKSDKAMEQLSNDGLKSFKVVKSGKKKGSGGKKNGAVSKGRYEIIAGEITASIKDLEKLDPNDSELNSFYQQMAELKAAIKQRVSLKTDILAGQAKSTGVVNEEVDTSEEESEVSGDDEKELQAA